MSIQQKWCYLTSIKDICWTVHPLFIMIMLTSIITGRFVELAVLFVIVFIHECGHVAAAIILGHRVLAVQLLPFGGVAVIERRGHVTAAHEIIIALAGPLQNVVMVIVVIIMQKLQGVDVSFLNYVIQGNLSIALFNLLPVLPLDGGKIIQALISLVTSYYRTLVWTARISVVMSLTLIAIVLYSWIAGFYKLHLNALFMGLFLLYSNMVDFRNIPYVFLRFLIHRDTFFSRCSSSASLAQPIISCVTQPLETILRLFRREKYHIIYVINKQGEIEVSLPEKKIIQAYFQHTKKN